MGPQTYAVRLTAAGIASDGSTQPAGTVLNFVLWDGVSSYTPHDAAGNAANVQMVLAAPGMVAYAPNTPPPPSITNAQQDYTVVAGQTVMLAYGTSVTTLTGTGTLATVNIWMPPNAGVGTQVQIILLGTWVATALNVADSAGNLLHTYATVTAPKRAIMGLTAAGWQVIPN